MDVLRLFGSANSAVAFLYCQSVWYLNILATTVMAYLIYKCHLFVVMHVT